jgi:predicted SAM-dependent methyltransferase
MKTWLKRRVSRGVWEAAKQLRFAWDLQRRHRRGMVMAARLRPPLKLHLGCGPNLKAGWVNIDLFEAGAVPLDLRERFPFADGSVDVIHSEHVFEHFAYPGEAMHILRESYRVLRAGGRLSVVVPDTAPLLSAYVRGDAAFFERARKLWHPAWCDTWMHQVNYHFRQGTEHQYAYDEDTLSKLVAAAGFTDVHRRGPDTDLDSPRRLMGNPLAIMATKP